MKPISIFTFELISWNNILQSSFFQLSSLLSLAMLFWLSADFYSFPKWLILFSNQIPLNGSTFFWVLRTPVLQNFSPQIQKNVKDISVVFDQYDKFFSLSSSAHCCLSFLRQWFLISSRSFFNKQFGIKLSLNVYNANRPNVVFWDLLE